MAEIINLSERRPHLSGPAVCSCCLHKWVAVAEVGTWQLQCPQCRTMKGLWEHPYAPEAFFECNCGSHLFYIVSDGCRCRECGAYANGF